MQSGPGLLVDADPKLGRLDAQSACEFGERDNARFALHGFDPRDGPQVHPGATCELDLAHSSRQTSALNVPSHLLNSGVATHISGVRPHLSGACGQLALGSPKMRLHLTTAAAGIAIALSSCGGTDTKNERCRDPETKKLISCEEAIDQIIAAPTPKAEAAAAAKELRDRRFQELFPAVSLASDLQDHCSDVVAADGTPPDTPPDLLATIENLPALMDKYGDEVGKMAQEAYAVLVGSDAALEAANQPSCDAELKRNLRNFLAQRGLLG